MSIQKPKSQIPTVYRPDIDGLRAIAVLSVVIFHAFPKVLPAGFIGVDIFFVISGYLISTIIISQIQRDTFSILDFYTRRIRRIFPALVLVLFLSLVAGWILLLPGNFKSLGLHVAAGAAFASNFLLRSEAGYFDAAADQKPMLHLWSLSIEEQFYIVWPVLLIIFLRKFRSAFPLIVGGILLSFTQGILLLHDSSSSAFYLPTARFWELMIGALIAHFHLASNREEGGSVGVRRSHLLTPTMSAILQGFLSLLGVTLLASAFACIKGGTAFPGWWGLLPVGGAACLIAAGSSGLVNKWVLSNRGLVFIGLISYPLYLWHWPLLTIADLAAPEPLDDAKRLWLLALSFLFAWLTYALIENPLRHGARGHLKAAGLVCAMAGVGLSGWHIYMRQGYPENLPAIVKRIGEYGFDYKRAYRFGQCFFELQQVDRTFNDCTNTPKDSSAPRVFLWGDSHAAHLYPGLALILGDQVALSQLTTSECGPLTFGPPTSFCSRRNAEVLQRIKKEMPDVVILASNWDIHGEFAPRYLSGTLKALKELNVKKIIIVGQHPTWTGHLPSLLAHKVRGDPLNRLTKRLPGLLRNNPAQQDTRLRQVVEEFGGIFVAPFEVLCNVEGCLALAEDSPDSITTWDDAHLTTAGSRLLAVRLQRELP